MIHRLEFPFFTSNNYTYLDSSATTQVPKVVLDKVYSTLSLRGNPNRSSHKIAGKNQELIEKATENIARFIGASSEELVFTNNATDSANLMVESIFHLFEKGDEVILTISEHHSNMLPFKKLEKLGVKLKFLKILADGNIDLDHLRKVINKKTKLVSISHISNVLGIENNVIEIGKIIKSFNYEILYSIDGTQAPAHIPVNVKAYDCNFYFFSSHKMYGPDGVGILYVDARIHSLIGSVRSGGGTVKDVSITKDSDLIIDEYKSLISLQGGTPNLSNIIGLSEAVSYIRNIGFEEIVKHEKELISYIIEKTEKLSYISIVGNKNIDNRRALVSFHFTDCNLEELGNHLNKRNIFIRYGSHCAFPLTDFFGKESLRVSFGIYNSIEDIDKFLQELDYYFDKKAGLIKNKNLEYIKDQIYYKNSFEISNISTALQKLVDSIYDKDNTEIIIMAGHFLGIPDYKTNSFYPSIKPLIPERLHKLLDEFGMTNFPLFSWETGCYFVKMLKKMGINAKLLVIANDTTGINELKNSKGNKDNKSAKEYREEYLLRFGKRTLPKEYLDSLQKNNLWLDDVLDFDGDYFITESETRGRFKSFIGNNKEYFNDMIDYSTNSKGNIDLSIKVLDNQEIKACKFDTFQSKTGGKFCIVEVAQIISELFGASNKCNIDYIHSRVKSPVINSKNKVFFMITPAMCNSAVNSGAELYTKLFLQGANTGSFKFFNLPIGPEGIKYLARGTELTYISDKDNLIELESEKEPSFIELWRIVEYNLLYSIRDYMDEIESLFKKLKINKNSKIIDSCCGAGFFTKELIENEYNVYPCDINENNTLTLKNDLLNLGIDKKIIHSSWLDFDKHFERNSIDFIFNRGNAFIYAAGGWNENIEVDKKKSLEIYKQTLKVYYSILKEGGYLYIDKYKDSEESSMKLAAKLKVKSTKEKKDIIFKVERRSKDNTRYATIVQKDSKGNETEIPNIVYDLSEEELISILSEVGFKSERIKLKTEKNFSIILAKK